MCGLDPPVRWPAPIGPLSGSIRPSSTRGTREPVIEANALRISGTSRTWMAMPRLALQLLLDRRRGNCSQAGMAGFRLGRGPAAHRRR